MPLSLDLLLLREREVNISWLLSLSFAEMFVERSDSLLYVHSPICF